MSDDEPLGLPPMLPALVSPELSPTGGSVNVLDMISQDVMFGNSFQSMINSASTEVTYVSQYASPSATPFSSAAPFTSAGDVFLPSISITTAANTFVKPLHTYIPSLGRSDRSILKPYPKPAYRPATGMRPENPRSINPNLSVPYVYSPIPSHQKHMKTAFDETNYSKSEKPKKSSKMSSSASCKKSKSRSHSSHKTASRSKHSKKSSRSQSKAQSRLLHGSPQPSAFVPVSNRSSALRSTAVTHTVATETITYATTVTNTIGQRAAGVVRSAPKTATVTSLTVTKNQSPGTEETDTYSTIVHSNSSTTSIITSTVTRPRTPASIISPMQSTYLPSSMLRSGPTIISRTPSTAAGARPATPSSSSEKSREKLAKHPTQNLYAIAANVSDCASSEAGPSFQPQTRLAVPVNTYVTSAESTVTTTTTATKHAVGHTVRPTQSAHFGTNALTYDISTTATTAAMATRTQSTLALPPGATLYTARKICSSRATRSRSAVTTEGQTFTILDGKGSYTTLKFSSDFTTTTGSPLIVAQTQNTTAVTAGLVSHTSSVTTETVIRPGSQFLIPIANSQMNTSTSLGYLVTSPMGSDIITTRNSTAAAATQSAATTSIGTHTITTISSEALSRIRNRLIYNVPSTAAGLSSLSPSTIATDSNRTRGPVRIIANQLISGVSPRDSSGTSGTVASRSSASTRTLFSTAHQTQGLYAITTPISTHSPTTILDHTGRPVNRMVAPINVPVSHSSSSTQGNYILTTGIGPSTATTGPTKIRSSHTPAHNTNTAAATLISTTVATPTTRAFPGSTGGGAYTSSSGISEVHSKLRSRLTVHITTTESSMPCTNSPITAYAISKNRTPQSVFAVPSGSVTYPSSTKPSHTTTLSPATMTLITFSPPTSGGIPASSSPRRLAASTTVHCNPPSPTTVSSMATATPTLTNTGNRYVIKLATTPSGTTASSVTAAVTTPITTAALSPTEHTFLEPHPVPSRLRTFPAPRTYPVAQRLAAGNQQRPPVRNVNPRVKKVIANPAPLQIFADVVCPPSTAHSFTTGSATQAHSKSRFTLSQTSGSSTLVAPQYKHTVFKNISTISRPNSDRASSRFINPHASSERMVFNRPVAFMSPRRLSPVAHSAAQVAPTMTSPTQRTSRSERISPQTVQESSPDYQDHLFE